MCIFNPTVEAASKLHLSQLRVSVDASLEELVITGSVMREGNDPIDSVIRVGGVCLIGVTESVVGVTEDAVEVTETETSEDDASAGAMVAEGDEEAGDAEAAAEALAA